MPVLREPKVKPKSDLELAADAELEDARERAGIGPRAMAAKAERRKALLALERPLTDDEQDELDAIIIERQGARWHSKHFGALIRRAQAEWAERSGDAEWRALWEALAAESRRASRASRSTAEFEHLYHAITHTEEAKRIKRRHRRDFDAVWRLRRRIEKRAERAREAESRTERAPEAAVPAAPASHALPAAAEVVEPLEQTPRRRRIKYGVVAEYDAFGRRVL